MDKELVERLERIKRSTSGDTAEPVNNTQDDISDSVEVDEISEKVNYKEAIKKDMENIFDDEFNESRKQAFNQVKEDFAERVNGEKPKTAAELYEEKHATIKLQEKQIIEEEPNDMDPGESLLGSLDEIDKDSAEKARILEEEHRRYEEEKNKINENVDEEQGSETIEDILASIEETNTKKDLGLENDADTEDLTEMLEKLESQKQFASYIPTEEYTGPSSYVINKNEEFEDAVEDVLVSNNINIIKKTSNTEKSAILNKLTNSGDTVTVPLVNSGIYITVSGASIPEIIDMNNIASDGVDAILEKINFINNHIVDSSIGKMRLSQCIKVISYHDIETLYYALYAATYPENSEINRHCSRCNQEYFITMNTRDILRNPEDFVNDAKNIKDNVTTYDILRNSSLLNKIVQKRCLGGRVIVDIKHPTIESYCATMNAIKPEIMNKYSSTLIDMAYSISKLYVRKSGNDYIEITDPNVIIDTLSKIKDINLRYELLDMIEEIKPNALPSYGYKTTICPNCGNKDESTSFNMDDLLFIHAQQEDEMATLRWAAKLQKKRQSKKK